jgi:hypothetical protein
LTVTVYMESLVKARLSKPEQTSIKENFEQYKNDGSSTVIGVSLGHPFFGKDEGLTMPPEVRDVLQKVHIKPNSPKQIAKEWIHHISKGRIPVSNHIMIYTNGIKDPNAYLILDILRPDGHTKMLDFEHMKRLKALADIFRESY